MPAAPPPDDREPATPGATSAVASPAHDALFDLAVARADAYLRRARRPASDDPAGRRRALEVWALKTRFASRIDLAELVAALALRPAGTVRWRGGRAGGWVAEDAPPAAG